MATRSICGGGFPVASDNRGKMLLPHLYRFLDDHIQTVISATSKYSAASFSENGDFLISSTSPSFTNALNK
jgi:hypothetical protein